MGNKEYSISEVIDSFGLTKNTWTVFILLAFAMILDGYDFMIVNSTNLFVAHTFWPDNPNPGVLMGSLTTWGLLGMVIGGAIGGIVSDRIGRKKMLSCSTEPLRFRRHLPTISSFSLFFVSSRVSVSDHASPS